MKRKNRIFARFVLELCSFRFRDYTVKKLYYWIYKYDTVPIGNEYYVAFGWYNEAIKRYVAYSSLRYHIFYMSLKDLMLEY